MRIAAIILTGVIVGLIGMGTSRAADSIKIVRNAPCRGECP